MKLIPLTQGLHAIVDDEDYEWLVRWKWHARKGRHGVYALRWEPGGKGRYLRMHRVIMSPGEDEVVDHINGDSLDNRRCNLRVCDIQQNSFNQRAQRGAVSSYKGVSFCGGKWHSRITVYGNTLFLGQFDTEEEAAQAYNEAATKHHGEFARLNELPKRGESDEDQQLTLAGF